jgi:hypothetical protein
MLYKKISFLYILFFILTSTMVVGVGIGQYNREKQILFVPGLEKVYGFQLSDSLKIDASLEGDLAQYGTINDPAPGGPARNIEVVLRLPDYLEPGTHTLYIVATEHPSGTATVGGFSSVRVSMEVFALYPGKHPVLKGLVTNDVNVNGSTVLGLFIINYGEEAIDNAHGTISVYNQNNDLVTILNTDSKSIPPYGVETSSGILDTALFNMSPGNYRVVGNLTYDYINYDTLTEGMFIVGEMNINVLSTTTEMFVNSTNKFLITLQSEWTGDIDNIYARITLPNGKAIKTPNVDLYKPSQGVKATATVETYLETEGLELGPQNVEITLFYKGKSSTRNVMVNIVDGKPPVTEKPRIITPMVIFIAISVIIVLFVALYFLVFRKNGGGGSGRSSSTGSSNTQSTQSQPSGDIRPPSL